MINNVQKFFVVVYDRDLGLWSETMFADSPIAAARSVALLSCNVLRDLWIRVYHPEGELLVNTNTQLEVLANL